MFDMKIVKAFNKAIYREENWDSEGAIWNWVDSDMYMELNPQTSDEKKQYFSMFDDLADIHDSQYFEMTYDEFLESKLKIDVEYKELFGLSS